MAQRKHAILVGSSEFPESNGSLSPLACAATDVGELKALLSDPQYSRFDNVQVALDLPHYEVLLRINKVMRKASREDQIFLFYSGHGMLDGEARLHLATVNTEPEHLHATTIPADSLRSLFRETQCRRIVIVLDCCFAGTAGDQLQLDRFLQDSFRDTSDAISKGYAVCVIAASGADRAAYAPSNGGSSYMTAAMIEVIRSGRADRNQDGVVTIEEVYEGMRQEMSASGLAEPIIFHRGVVSSLTIANSPLPVVWGDIVSRIHNRIENAGQSQTGEGGNPANLRILDRARHILSLPEEVVLHSYDALLSLLKDWSQDRLAFDELTNQWYQFDKTDLVAADKAADAPALAAHWENIHQARAAVLDLVSPAYILDRDYHFLDWNAAFDEVLAKQMGLVRFRHVEDFILRLDNHREVIERGQRIFSEEKYPLVDVEDLVYVSPKYGRILFKKIAAQIPDQEGDILAWSVNLNVVHADNADELWNDLHVRLNEEVNWSIYAKLYDRMLSRFDQYQHLIEQMVGLLGPAKSVADLGAGTGNVLVELLHQQADRSVLAVEGNEGMLDQLRAKFSDGLADQMHRVRIFKGDIVESLREVDENTFDGVILMNVLYAVHNRARCLREIYRVLKPGGVVVYSTSTDQTDVDALFAAIRDDMAGKGLLHEMTPVIDLAYDRHQDMIENILADDEQAVVDYALHAGFDVDPQGVLHKEYVGAVTIVKATKPDYLSSSPLDPATVADPGSLETGLGCDPLPRSERVGFTQTDPSSEVPQLFISYAHEDRAWCERIRKYLKPAEDAGSIRIWVDGRIDPGQAWEAEIENNLQRSTIALLLVTPNFLASRYIKDKELPWLLTRRAHEKLEIVPVLIEHGLTAQYAYPYQDPDGQEQTLRLNDIQFLSPGGKAIAQLDTSQQNLFIDELARRILTLAEQKR